MTEFKFLIDGVLVEAANTLGVTTPLTTLRLGELCARVLPAGVVNVIVDQNDRGGRPRGVHPGDHH